jgi:hypothetical protein
MPSTEEHLQAPERQRLERRMHLSQFHYLPLTPGFFSILIALFVGLLVIMIVLGALRHAEQPSCCCWPR